MKTKYTTRKRTVLARGILVKIEIGAAECRASFTHAFLKVKKGLKKTTFFGKFGVPTTNLTEEGHDGV
jgi:hypothetical protein